MVREKQAFLRNVVVLSDALVIGVAFVSSYFISFYLREAYGLGEMAYAISPDWKGLSHFTEQNIALVGFYLIGWLWTLGFVGAYKDLRTHTFFKGILQILAAG